MPRAIVTGNGNLLACLNKHNLLEDFYFPYVGMEDHIAFEHWHRLGIHDGHHFSWIDEDHWHHETNYLPDSLVTDSSARSASAGRRQSGPLLRESCMRGVSARPRLCLRRSVRPGVVLGYGAAGSLLRVDARFDYTTGDALQGSSVEL